MIHLLYDGSFEGFFTALFYAYKEKEASIFRQEQYAQHLFATTKIIEPEIDKFERIYNSVWSKLSYDILKQLYYLYLSELPDAETLALKYLRLCYKYGTSITLAKNNDIVIEVDTICRKVGLEAHRLQGFVRFKEIRPDFFYATIEPRHDTLPLLVTHFTTRFNTQNFVIYDKRREYALVYNKEQAVFKPIPELEHHQLLESANEDQFEGLFKAFYRSVTIEERTNRRAQLRYMPKDYWKNLTEFS